MIVLAVFAAALCVINIILWLVLFLKFRSRFSPQHILSDIRVEVDKLITEISKEADRDISLLEGRIRGLKSLIEEADRHITLSRRETVRRESEGKTLSELGALADKNYKQKDISVPSSAVASVPVMPRNTAADRYRHTAPETADTRAAHVNESAGISVAGNTDTPSRAADIPVQPRVTVAEQQIKPKIPVRDQILVLYRAGFTVELIAERLSVTVAEVELTVSLYTPEL